MNAPAAPIDRGYIAIRRMWQPGDRVQLDLEMPVERVYAHPQVGQDVGAVALQRGPLVYCAEQADQAEPVQRLRLPAGAALDTHFEPGLLGGVVVITADAAAADEAEWDSQLYRSQAPSLHPVQLKAIPYYAWDNREAGGMQVWLPEVA